MPAWHNGLLIYINCNVIFTMKWKAERRQQTFLVFYNYIIFLWQKKGFLPCFAPNNFIPKTWIFFKNDLILEKITYIFFKYPFYFIIFKNFSSMTVLGKTATLFSKKLQLYSLSCVRSRVTPSSITNMKSVTCGQVTLVVCERISAGLHFSCI